MPLKTQILGLILSFVITFSASVVGAAASIQAASFYGQLIQPVWAPPAWVFGPVWTALFTMMAVAAWLVWRSGGFRVNRLALCLFIAQFALNAAWSWLFFAWHLGALAFVDILLLWALLFVIIVLFWRVRPIAGALLIPYWLWVSFAAVLNYTLWQLNPQVLG